MSTAQLDHLRAIDAHLKNLLDIEAKRTPGEWGVEQTDTTNWIGPMRHDGDKIDLVVCDTDRDGLKLRAINQNDANAAFIASCAGNAEAGWKAARAVIKSYYDSGICREWQGYMQSAIEPILAAFPLESLKA